MKNVIIPGIAPEKIGKVIRLTCPDCQTLFEAEKEDFRDAGNGYWTAAYRYIDCPCCNRRMQVSLTQFLPKFWD